MFPFEVFAAAMAERGRILFDLSPALRADEIIYQKGLFGGLLAGEADPRKDDIHQALHEFSQHVHIITIKP